MLFEQKKILEIMLQTQALLVFNGYGQDVLTNQPEFIYLFSIMLTSNCFCIDVLWSYFLLTTIFFVFVAFCMLFIYFDAI